MHVVDDGVQPPPPLSPAPVSIWTRRQDKQLEMLLCRLHPRWEWNHIAAHLGDKTAAQASHRYERMVAELRRVLEAPGVETPPEWDLQVAAPALARGEAAVVEDAAARAGGDQEGLAAPATDVGEDVAAAAPATTPDGAILGDKWMRGGKRNKSVKWTTLTGNERKRGGQRKNPVSWTTEEHRLFLAGIKKYGKGRWKTLAAEFVQTRSASQIASHFQKYAIRKEKRKRNECKRASIHDIGDTDAAGDHDDETSAAAGDESAGEDDLAAIYDL